LRLLRFVGTPLALCLPEQSAFPNFGVSPRRAGEQMQTYCERCGPGLFDEPINAVSNVVFLVAAWAAWRLAVREGRTSVGLWVLIGLSVCVGVGSTLWHTFATPWALLFDILPILLFQIAFLWLYGRYIAELPAAVVVAVLVVYVGVGLGLRAYREWLNGVLIYAPTLVVSWVVGWHCSLSSRKERFILLMSAAVFCAALIARSLDLVLCRQLPIGTHFLWHVLDGLVVYLAMRAWIASRPMLQTRPMNADVVRTPAHVA
jgi:hypothetical protein